MQYIHDLIQHHGNLFYLITFIWTALEGETFVIFAGLFAQKGALNVWLLFLAAWLGSMFGDQVVFMIGRKVGPKILDHLPRIKPGVEKAVGWLDQYAVLFILCYRFMYGVRNVSSLAVGLSHISWRKFAVWNAIAAFVWAAAFVGVGYIYGDVISHMRRKQEVVEDSLHQLTYSLLGLFVFLIVIKVIIIRWHRYRVAKKAKLLSQIVTKPNAHISRPEQ